MHDEYDFPTGPADSEHVGAEEKKKKEKKKKKKSATFEDANNAHTDSFGFAKTQLGGGRREENENGEEEEEESGERRQRIDPECS